MNKEIRDLPPLERAARLVGGFAELGRRLGGQSRQTLNNWQKRGVPSRYHVAIQNLTESLVKATELEKERAKLQRERQAQKTDAETA